DPRNLAQAVLLRDALRIRRHDVAHVAFVCHCSSFHSSEQRGAMCGPDILVWRRSGDRNVCATLERNAQSATERDVARAGRKMNPVIRRFDDQTVASREWEISVHAGAQS